MTNPYKGNANTHWRGIVVLNEVYPDGRFSVMDVTLAKLCEKYAGESFASVPATQYAGRTRWPAESGEGCVMALFRWIDKPWGRRDWRQAPSLQMGTTAQKLGDEWRWLGYECIEQEHTRWTQISPPSAPNHGSWLA